MRTYTLERLGDPAASFPFSAVHDAYAYFMRGRSFGKVIVTVP
jgi:NADPH:quinone reductase-like Zn-dependent oxidoreductase